MVLYGLNFIRGSSERLEGKNLATFAKNQFFFEISLKKAYPSLDKFINPGQLAVALKRKEYALCST